MWAFFDASRTLISALHELTYFFLPKCYHVHAIIIFISTVKQMREVKWLVQSLAAGLSDKTGNQTRSALISGPAFWVNTLVILDNFSVTKSLVSISVPFHSLLSTLRITQAEVPYFYLQTRLFGNSLHIHCHSCFSPFP